MIVFRTLQLTLSEVIKSMNSECDVAKSVIVEGASFKEVGGINGNKFMIIRVCNIYQITDFSAAVNGKMKYYLQF